MIGGLNEEKRESYGMPPLISKKTSTVIFIFIIIIITTITIIFLIKGASLKQDTKSAAKTSMVTEVK